MLLKITTGCEIQSHWLICLWHHLAKKVLFRKRNTPFGSDCEILLLSIPTHEINWY